jgi:hypothetical protein
MSPDLDHLILIAYVPVLVVLFSYLPRPRALVLYTVIGVLFLPEVHYMRVTEDAPTAIRLPGLCLSKPNVLAYGMLLASLWFDGLRWAAFRFRRADLPVFLNCLMPVVSGFVNGMSFHDSFAELRQEACYFAVPYVAGRLYLGDRDSFRDLVAAVFVGGLAYVPLCLAEMQLGPKLHLWVYGFYQHDPTQAVRFDGIRPVLFMEHGLALGLWMSAACLAGYWLWRAGLWERIGLPDALARRPGLTLLGLAATTVACKSTGAIILGVAGAAVLHFGRSLRTPKFLAVLMLVPVVYVAVRTTGFWDGKELVAAAGSGLNEDRAGSIGFRLRNENLLRDKALKRPLLGWGGGGRYRVIDEEGEDVAVTDGLWIMALGSGGFVGLTATFGILLLPPYLFLRRYPPAAWADPAVAPLAVGAVVLAIFAVDCLFNAMLNPVYVLMAGGLTTLAVGAPTEEPAAEVPATAAPPRAVLPPAHPGPRVLGC